MDEKIYQTVLDALVDFLPDGWKSMVFYAGYTRGSYTMKFYTENGDRKYMDCFSMPGITKASLIKLFMEIDKILSDQRKSLSDDKIWTVFTMRVDSDGHMKTNYDYDDHSEDMVAYEQSWENQYLV